MRRHLLRSAVALLAGAATLTLPQVVCGGSQDEHGRRAADAMQGGLPLDALDRLVDQAAQELPRSLLADREVADVGHLPVLLVDRFGNQVAQNPTLDAALSSVQIQLGKSGAMRQNSELLGLTSKQGSAALQADGAGKHFEFHDGVELSPSGPRAYHPDDLYVIRGRVYEARDPASHLRSVE